MRLSAYILVIMLIASPVFTEDADPAVLLRGPVRHQGIEFLGVNAIDSEYGEYSYQGDIITVYYTEELIVLDESWTTADCEIPGLKIKNSGDSSEPDKLLVFAYSDPKDWTAFLSFSAESDYACNFIAQYRLRQNYFINIARGDVFSFPAILNIE